MENVAKGHIIHSYEINIWNLNSKYHTTTDHTKRHMKIHTMENPYHCCLCAKKSISRSHMKSHAKSESFMHSVEGKSYQGTLKETQ